MKKTIFVLPLCLVFAFCSRKTVPPPPTGISNVNVGQGDSMVSAAKVSSNYGTSDKDWSYKASKDTMLNGSWTLEGMLQANGSWSTTEKTDAAAMGTNIATDTAMAIGTNETVEKGNTKSTAAKRMGKRNALYESAKSRLKMEYKAGSAIDTSAIEPYAYWKRIPAITFTRSTFYGNTGCNSMSGSVNYNNRDLQFGKNIVTSKMACMDYDESNFLVLLKKADSYSISGNMLEIRQGTTVLMTLKR